MPVNNMPTMNPNQMGANPMGANSMNSNPMNANPMNANPMNSNPSSMNSLGQIAQMGGNPNSHMNMNMSSPNGDIYNRPENSSPSIPVNSPTMGPNGNRVPGSASPHMGMNSPNMAMNQMNVNSINNMNAPPMMGGPMPPNQNPHAMKNNGQMCAPMNNPMANMMPQQGSMPPNRMNMANGNHPNQMNPNMMSMQCM